MLDYSGDDRTAMVQSTGLTHRTGEDLRQGRAESRRWRHDDVSVPQLGPMFGALFLALSGTNPRGGSAHMPLSGASCRRDRAPVWQLENGR